MQFTLFLIFIAVPITEIALFIQAGQIIGLWPTIAITIGTAIAGSFLMRVQGFATLSRFAQAAERGEMPVTPVIDGIGILTAGLLLLTPGLFTDTIGLLLFVPPLRHALARWVFERALKRGNIHIRGFGGPTSPHSPSPPRHPTGFAKSDNVVDAEFETIDPENEETQDTPLDKKNGSQPRSGPRDTPWRPK